MAMVSLIFGRIWFEAYYLELENNSILTLEDGSQINL